MRYPRRRPPDPLAVPISIDPESPNPISVAFRGVSLLGAAPIAVFSEVRPGRAQPREPGNLQGGLTNAEAIFLTRDDLIWQEADLKTLATSMIDRYRSSPEALKELEKKL